MTNLDWIIQIVKKNSGDPANMALYLCAALSSTGANLSQENDHSWPFICLISLPDDHLILVPQLSSGQMS